MALRLSLPVIAMVGFGAVAPLPAQELPGLGASAPTTGEPVRNPSPDPGRDGGPPAQRISVPDH